MCGVEQQIELQGGKNVHLVNNSRCPSQNQKAQRRNDQLRTDLVILLEIIWLQVLDFNSASSKYFLSITKT